MERNANKKINQRRDEIAKETNDSGIWYLYTCLLSFLPDLLLSRGLHRENSTGSLYQTSEHKGWRSWNIEFWCIIIFLVLFLYSMSLLFFFLFPSFLPTLLCLSVYFLVSFSCIYYASILSKSLHSYYHYTKEKEKKNISGHDIISKLTATQVKPLKNNEVTGRNATRQNFLSCLSLLCKWILVL